MASPTTHWRSSQSGLPPRPVRPRKQTSPKHHRSWRQTSQTRPPTIAPTRSSPTSSTGHCRRPISRIRADIEAALRNPLLTLPPLPSFWPALPPGIPIRAVSHIPTGPPITPQPMPPMVRVRVDAGPSYGSYYRDIPFAALDPTLRSTAIDPLTGVWHDTPTLQAIWQGAPTAPALTTLAPPPTGYESVRQPPTITRETRQITITIAPPPGAPAPRGR